MKTILDFQKAKGKEILTWITAYDYPIACAAQRGGIEMILVGDSGYMCSKGYANTNFATMDGCIDMCQCVRKGAPDVFIWGDMPSQSYEESDEVAIHNALRFIKEGQCNGIKLEGSSSLILQRIRAISSCNINCCGHIGLAPQASDAVGGYKVQGKTIEGFESLLEQAKNIERAGAKMVLIEAVPQEVTQQIAKQCKIIVAGIGAGRADVQLIINSDLLGFYPDFRPKFASCYIPKILDKFNAQLEAFVDVYKDLKNVGKETRRDGLLELATLAIREYVKDVKSGVFPTNEELYKLKPEELSELEKSQYWRKENE